MKLYEFAPTRSIRIRWTLRELGVDFEAITVNLLAGEQRSPAFLKINPAGKLPVLVDGDTVLTESIAIVLYLAEKYRDKGLIPTACSNERNCTGGFFSRLPSLSSRCGALPATRHFIPRASGCEVALARDDFSEMANVLEEYMSGRKFVVGDTATSHRFGRKHVPQMLGFARGGERCDLPGAGRCTFF
jgi:glutathione S-transferase